MGRARITERAEEGDVPCGDGTVEVEDAEVVVGCNACGNNIFFLLDVVLVDAAGSDFGLGSKKWMMTPQKSWTRYELSTANPIRY